jgi:predicted methyltransferase
MQGRLKPLTASLLGGLLISISSSVMADAKLRDALESIRSAPHRTEVEQQRDSARHPVETLSFFEVDPSKTIVEVWPGKGWYTDILAPYVKQFNGRFIAAGFPKSEGPAWRIALQQGYENKLKQTPIVFDQVEVVELGPPNYWRIGDKNSVDTVLTFRNVHNWMKGGYENEMMNAFFAVLKPNGVLGIVEHRANNNTDIDVMKQSGYVTESYVIELAKKAGFILEARSEINANPKDTKYHPNGVWTLPPTLKVGESDPAVYLAIGESDRMTLKFRKPAL